MSQFLFKKEVQAYVVISRFGKLDGEQFEVRLRADDDWVAFLNFRQVAGDENVNGRNSQGIPELFAPPAQYAGVIDLLRQEKPIWFTLYEAPLSGWLSTSAEPVGTEVVTYKESFA